MSSSDAASQQPPLLSDHTAQEVLQPLISSAIAFIVLNTVFLVGRLLSRFAIRKLPFWWDDFWVLPAWVCNIGGCAIGLYMAQVEIGYDNEDRFVANLDELSHLLKAIYAIEQLILIEYLLTRFSILALYLRIFSDKNVRRACWITGGLLIAQWFAFAMGMLLQCQPVQFFWDRAIPGGTCINIDAFYRVVTIPNIIFDVVIIVLPIPTVWQLKASTTRKWGLTMIFCIGTMALVASCIRLYAYEIHTSTKIAPSWTSALVMWLIIEPGIYLIAACLPAMHHLFAAMVPEVVQEALEQRLAGIRHPLSGRGAPSPNDNRAGSHPLYGEFTKLSESRTQSHAASLRKFTGRKGSNKSDDYELEAGRFPSNAILVTTEVIITQEERIAEVIGF